MSQISYLVFAALFGTASGFGSGLAAMADPATTTTTTTTAGCMDETALDYKADATEATTCTYTKVRIVPDSSTGCGNIDLADCCDYADGRPDRGPATPCVIADRGNGMGCDPLCWLEGTCTGGKTYTIEPEQECPTEYTKEPAEYLSTTTTTTTTTTTVDPRCKGFTITDNTQPASTTESGKYFRLWPDARGATGAEERASLVAAAGFSGDAAVVVDILQCDVAGDQIWAGSIKYWNDDDEENGFRGRREPGSAAAADQFGLGDYIINPELGCTCGMF